MQKTELESALESILFYVGDSVPSGKLSEICEAEEITIHMAIYRLNEWYEKTGSGIEIIEVDNGYQMCTVPRNIGYIQRYKQKPVKKLLTQALLETLAIVAYSQPITKAQIEDIRGVRCEHAVSKLLEYDLIEEVGRLNVIGRPILFGTTTSFLRHFGFKNIEELPKVKEELIERFKKEIEEEMNYISEETANEQLKNELENSEETDANDKE
ncbi:SMC-Scp complex subunit ScpB [Niameybacter massiliensis]|uniref:SMC-Scp complex subunit ScpB n=1 Tax=Holtiella tumoricola TaxID=3018743 RepID=A0AA42DP54_9FIRM|nr:MULTISPECIES: SMC-Scp complex subunit ScpB [Lachnospirales]MDA3732492.1 SMC-Scp complex subunit ScpB [Holtiella tumoricola]